MSIRWQRPPRMWRQSFKRGLIAACWLMVGDLVLSAILGGALGGAVLLGWLKLPGVG